MYIIFTFVLIILIPTFLALIVTGNIKQNIKAIVGVGVILALILGYLYIPHRLPLNKTILETSSLYYQSDTYDKHYQRNFLLLPRDRADLVALLSQQKFYPLMEDRSSNLGHYKIFEVIGQETLSHCRIKISENGFSTLDNNNRAYHFKASKTFIQLVDEFSKKYDSVLYDNSEMASLEIDLNLTALQKNTYALDLNIHTKDTDTLITEINRYYEYNSTHESVGFLLNASPVHDFEDEIEISMTRGTAEHLHQVKDCKLIIRGQYNDGEGLMPFQKLVDLDELIDRKDTKKEP